MLLLFLSCSEWPTYDHIEGFPDAVDSTENHRADVSVIWVPIQEDENDDLLNDQVVSSLNNHSEDLIIDEQGIEFSGRINGTGWLDTVDTGEEINQYFPYQGGHYIGDVDWLQVSPPSAATLCVSLVTNVNPGTIIDVMVYPLDTEIDPTEGPYSDFEGIVAGYNQTSFPAEYSSYIGHGRTLGLVVAAEAPNDVDNDIPYKLYISLMPTDNTGARSPCPLPPEE